MIYVTVIENIRWEEWVCVEYLFKGLPFLQCLEECKHLKNLWQ